MSVTDRIVWIYYFNTDRDANQRSVRSSIQEYAGTWEQVTKWASASRYRALRM